MKAIMTQTKQVRMQQYAAIAARYKELNTAGSQITAVTERVAAEMGISTALVYKVRRLYRLHKRRIERCDVIKYHDKMIAEGATSAEAKRKTADKFGCTPNYIYQLVNMASL